jgi:hypothetical protein
MPRCRFQICNAIQSGEVRKHTVKYLELRQCIQVFGGQEFDMHAVIKGFSQHATACHFHHARRGIIREDGDSSTGKEDRIFAGAAVEL